VSKSARRHAVVIQLLDEGDVAVPSNVAADVLDDPVQTDLSIEFLADPRHHIAVALEGTLLIGFASGVHTLHPDEPAELFINEVGVAPAHQRQGVAARLIARLLEHGRSLGCREAWVATEPENEAARALYHAAGGREDPTRFIPYSFPLASPSGRPADGASE
jgi:ribosomal protein S18 acetylase RimI-like enzyme